MLLNNRYEYEPATDLIGKGGLAEVYKAYDKETGRYVAIKKFHAADSLKYSLKSEFQKSLNFAHDNLVRAYDFFSITRKFDDGETHETQYGVMELIEGGDLAKYLQTKPPKEELLQVVKGILRGLSYLHTPNPNTDKGTMIHRDIKPGNILIYYNQQGKPIPKITDFNIAKEATTATESSQSMVGTYEYMAPEQLNPTKYSINGKVQPNADLWALGVILCDYFMGKSLFGKRSEGKSEGQIIGNILDEAIPTAEAIKKLPAPFSGIIARCLVRPAKNRIESAHELLKWIDKEQEGTITTPPPDAGKTTIPQPPAPPNYTKAGLIIGFLLLLCGVIYMALPERGETFATNTDDDPFAADMVYVQGGTFTMGCTEEQFGDCVEDEKPAHPQTVGSFYISKYEVTQVQWQEIMGSNPSKFTNCAKCPVESVSYDDIQEFLEKLNQRTGKNYRLPTEAEWEYAARGGNRSVGYKYAGSNDINSVAWYRAPTLMERTRWVGGKQPNELELYDMSGNVWEWCSDWYKGYPNNRIIPDYTRTHHVLRGGSWYSNWNDCRVTSRYYDKPFVRTHRIGFRLCQ